MPEPLRSHVDLDVRYAETDQMGVVHHATYPVWFEVARTAHCAHGGRDYAAIEAAGYWLMVTGLDVRYRRAVRYGHRVRVVCWIAALASRSLRFGYEVRRGEALAATGTTDHVWVRARDRRICRLPAELAAGFERIAG